ncbi:MAG: L,D-transpeptidase family protein [Sphaerobacter sp.]|nr:L,D-transpeptidase family protein [Sphaerobacter sp.]
MPRHRRWLPLLVVLIAGLIAGGSGALSAPRARAADILPAQVYFHETGHHLGGDFLTAWQANGGLMTFGYPLSEPFVEDGMLVQYFERARFEHHPQFAGTRYVVQATLLGNWVAERMRQSPPFQPLPPDTGTGGDPDRLFFPETGHSLAYGFKHYWETHGGLYVFGYPISEEFTENGRTVQYFERARFEWHPEHRGTEFEILLGRLGADYAAARGVNIAPVPKAAGAISAFPGLLDPAWGKAIRTGDGAVIGVVTGDSLNIRSAPRLNAPVVGTTYRRHPVIIRGIVEGDPVDGVPVWYQIGDGRYLAAVWVRPLVPTAPPRTYGGKWVDVNLSTFYAVAYEGSRPVYAAIITAGRDGKTPVGVFNVMYRVRNETMDSATVGIPKGHPGYYHLENVQFTQYFKSGGYALHQNYWTPPWAFGGFGSNGCVGLLLPDAEWFWNFLSIGSVVAIHY